MCRYVYVIADNILIFNRLWERMRRYEKTQILICNQGVGGSSPSAGTNKNMYDPETWVTDCT